MTAINTAMVARGVSSCAGAPDPTMGTVTNVVNTCLGGNAVFTIPWTGMTFGTYVIDMYRKMWKDSESEPGSFSFWKRITSGSSTTETESDIGSDGGGASRTERRKYKIRVVNTATPNGGTPHCEESLDSNQSNAAGNLCVF